MNAFEPDFSDPSGDDFEALARDHIPVRSMVEADLSAIIGIDRKITGKDRTTYYKAKLAEVLDESGVRLSLVAEVDGQFAGFAMARVDYGEFGRTSPSAFLDTIGVSPAFDRQGVGKALVSQLLLNLRSLKVEAVYTRADWNHFPLLAFLDRTGFHSSQRLSFVRRL
ncbi:MAG: GNAT family N-acetyltransferase [Magnetospirillum sp.]|nr:GNAT family N-acetyltransferase [Magnetospirillum sp.]